MVQTPSSFTACQCPAPARCSASSGPTAPASRLHSRCSRGSSSPTSASLTTHQTGAKSWHTSGGASFRTSSLRCLRTLSRPSSSHSTWITSPRPSRVSWGRFSRPSASATTRMIRLTFWTFKTSSVGASRICLAGSFSALQSPSSQCRRLTFTCLTSPHHISMSSSESRRPRRFDPCCCRITTSLWLNMTLLSSITFPTSSAFSTASLGRTASSPCPLA
mmetsp:Transcript_33016/g.77204  ORF Transcript_33016/g.77204 Transcript_33016/m.77204 type:complete len:219 (+) Transcript_33016:517-1173(+)